jgi:hypothetical protein
MALVVFKQRFLIAVHLVLIRSVELLLMIISTALTISEVLINNNALLVLLLHALPTELVCNTQQVKEMESWRRNQNLRIPADIQYTHEELPPVSAEELEKLRLVLVLLLKHCFHL